MAPARLRLRVDRRTRRICGVRQGSAGVREACGGDGRDEEESKGGGSGGDLGCAGGLGRASESDGALP